MRTPLVASPSALTEWPTSLSSVGSANGLPSSRCRTYFLPEGVVRTTALRSLFEPGATTSCLTSPSTVMVLASISPTYGFTDLSNSISHDVGNKVSDRDD